MHSTTAYDPIAIAHQRRLARMAQVSMARFQRREDGKVERLARAQAKRDRRNAKRAAEAVR